MVVFFQFPCLCVFLAMAGILLMYWEANRPGMVVPGCSGLLLLLYSLHLMRGLTIAPGFAALVLCGYALAIVDAWMTVHGLLAVAAAAVMAIGIYGLFPDPINSTPWLLSFFASATFNGVTSYLATVALKARRAKRAMRLERDTLNAVFRP